MKKKISIPARFFGGSAGITNLAYSLAIPVAITVAAYLSLGAAGPLLQFLLLVIAAEIVFFVRARTAGIPRVMIDCVFLAAYVVSGTVIYVLVIMVPFPVYKAWLSSIGEQSAGGTISFLFVLGAGFVSSAFAGSVHNRGRLEPLLGIAFSISLLVTVLFQNWILALAGVVLFLAYLAYLLVAAGKYRTRSFAFAAMALCVVLAVSGVLAAVTRADSGRFVSMTINPDLKRFVVDSFGRSEFVSSLAGYGFSFDMEHAGGKPALSTRQVFSVEASPGEVVYVRSYVFDDYGSNTWRAATDPKDVPSGTGLSDDSSSAQSGETIRLRILLDYYPVIPHMLSVHSMNVSNAGKSFDIIGSTDTGFVSTLPLIRDNLVVMTLSQPESPVKRRLLSIIETNLAMQSESDFRPLDPRNPEYVDRYLVVPRELENGIREIANAASGKKTGEAEHLGQWKMLRNIYLYLADNYSFSLDTTNPGDADFVIDFLLSSKKGYSVHFASAFVMLARMNGIPARLAAGFLAILPKDSGSVVATGYNAHVWAEVRVDSIGWVRIEACPFLDARHLDDPDFYARFNKDGDPETERQLSAFMGNRIGLEQKQGEPQDIGPVLAVSAAALLGTLACVTAYFLILRFVRSRVRLKKNAKKVYLKALRLVKRYDRKGVALPVTSGWRTWKEEMERRYPSKKTYIESIVSVFEKTFYSGKDPGDEDVRNLKASVQLLDRE